MSLQEIFRAVWRQKLIVALIIVCATLATYLAAQLLPPVYESKTTLLVDERTSEQDGFQALQSAQSRAKTYAELIQSRNVARVVEQRLPADFESPDDLLDRLAFQPIADTQLISITAQHGTAAGAALLANTYGETFIDYAEDNFSSATASDMRIVDRGLPAGGPIRPRPLLYAAVMLLLSTIAGVSVAILIDRLRGGIGDEDRATTALGLPVVARIPVRARRRGSSGEELAFRETVRVLHTNLRFLRPGGAVRQALITSAGPEEGKSLLATTLAQVIAESGQRVILIEGDLRRPTLSQSLGVDARLPGMTQYLIGESSFEQVAHPTPHPGLVLVPAGAIPPNPASLLAPDVIKRLVGDASEAADYVIVDGPPVSAGADALILGHSVGHVLFVVNQRTTRVRRAVAAVGQLRQADCDVVGLVINAAEDSPVEPYGYDSQTPPAAMAVSHGDASRSAID